MNKCVDSIRNQTYNNLEIILVDDGSPDNCGEICEKLADIDKRIKVIHKKNGGLSDARNAGLDVAKGTYVLFCDSDDWMEKNTILNAVSVMVKMNAQMVIWGYSADYEDADGKVIQSSLCKVEKVLEEGCTNDFTDRHMQGLIGYAWNKLYTRTIIEGKRVRFEKGISLVEDVLFNAQAMTQCKKIAFIDEIGTHYMQRNATTLGNAFYPNYADLIIRAVTAKQAILEHFHCSQTMIHSTMSDYAMMAIKVGVLGIINNQTISNGERTERIKIISISESMTELIRLAKPKTIKDLLLIKALRLRAFGLITRVG